ncbi:hypothetical protein [Bradyrhizobium sp. S69]|uniref:hypothetical protein n=1 Tax=Bradyrhizobium sp. S69 TaxID=1641856 RepID=UPI00131AC876|nr:hypothetical protein [Bradyrhizobium sp. S69]
MKLIDLVKRVEAAGLEVRLNSDKDGSLFLWGWTNRPAARCEPVFGCILESETNDVASRSEVRIAAELAVAAEHPDAIWSREINAKIDEKNAVGARAANAA